MATALRLTLYDTAEEFLAKAQPSLVQEEARSNLMLGICLRLCRDSGWLKAPPYFATVTGPKGVVASAIMTPPYKLILQGTPDTRSLGLIADSLVSGAQGVPGVLGPTPLPCEFVPVWRSTTGAGAVCGMRQRVYELRSVVKGGAVGGLLRPARSGDQDLIADWTLRFQEEALSGGTEEEVRKATKSRIADGAVFLWVDRRPVSMAAATRRTVNGISLNLVYTPPEFRRKGYGTACVAALSRHLLDSGYAFCALFADLANPTSNSLYLRVGYRPVCDFEEYLFLRGS